MLRSASLSPLIDEEDPNEEDLETFAESDDLIDLPHKNKEGFEKTTAMFRFPEVTPKNYKEISETSLRRFLALLSQERSKDWKRLKNYGLVTIEKRTSEDQNPIEIVKGTIDVNLAPSLVFEALRNERYSHLLHPDFLSSEVIEVLSLFSREEEEEEEEEEALEGEKKG